MIKNAAETGEVDAAINFWHFQAKMQAAGANGPAIDVFAHYYRQASAGVTGLIGLVLGAPLALMPTGSLFALLWGGAAGWVQLMVSASILTTLYGHYIEKRPLV